MSLRKYLSGRPADEVIFFAWFSGRDSKSEDGNYRGSDILRKERFEMTYQGKDCLTFEMAGSGKEKGPDVDRTCHSLKVRGLLAAAGGLALFSFCSSFCTDVRGTLNSMANNYIYPIMKWGGAFFVLLGIAQAAKGIMDSTSGQEQPGTMGKALGKFAIGVILVAGQTIIASVGG